MKCPDFRGLLTHVLTHFFDAYFCHNSCVFSDRPGLEAPPPSARFHPTCTRATRPGQTGARLPCTAVCPMRTASAPPAIWPIDPCTKERKVFSPDCRSSRLWLADGQSRLHLFTVRLWDGQKSLIPSTRCVVGDLKFSRNSASPASTRSFSANWSVVTIMDERRKELASLARPPSDAYISGPSQRGTGECHCHDQQADAIPSHEPASLQKGVGSHRD